ncbi:molybdenum cofactor biosynthesis protein MoaE [Allosphingosinicella deserti]|uniref:Molybdopterin synthase catalytic subunit n=1 Tax=Allosphingosinicella deserti TaxID=2116704 RepID=A0A2P7QS39_9SPHN|nr:molybdenum cofactor biosynthesis protein MoaE [Sphingomonas deserti]PSJ40793.1 molybdopterin synthase catalytic subunit [Sphingomonas deserti]
MIDARIQAGDFEPGRQLQRLEELGAGAIASMTIVLRAAADVREVQIDHYPALARNVLARIAAEAETRFGLSGIILIHRHGLLAPGDRIALAAATSADPKAALDGCAFLSESLGKTAPFWRKDVKEDGSAVWR